MVLTLPDETSQTAHMTKGEIRSRMRARRALVDDPTRIAASGAITAALLDLPEFQQAREVAIFLSLPRELETGPIIAACHRLGKRVCVPAWDPESRAYAFARLRPEAGVVPGPHGVPEPAHREPIDPQQIDLVVVPGLAFDRRGGRLGYGGGYYDRMLPTCRADCFKVGVAYAWQVVETELPLRAHDARVDRVITDLAPFR